MIKYGIKTGDWQGIIKAITKCIRVEGICLFGSRALSKHHTGSDIDLALYGKNISFADVNHIYMRLDELNLPYKFDIVVYDNIEQVNLKSHIERVGVILYSNN